MKNACSIALKKALVVLSLLALQACAPQQANTYHLDVVDAISSSDGIVVAPYERTIFSSSNF